MKQTANGNYLWLVLLAFFLIMPVINAFTEKPEPPKSWPVEVEQTTDLPAKRK